MRNYLILFSTLSIFTLLTACQGSTASDTVSVSAGLPTLLPTAALLAPTLESESNEETGIAANGLPITNTPIPPTETPTETPTPDPRTPTATPTPDYSINPAVNITALTKDSYLAGETITLSGRATFRSDQTLHAVLFELDGTEVSEAEMDNLSFGSWEATLNIPETISGHLYFQAEVREQDGEQTVSDRIRITVEANREIERFLALDRPMGDETGGAGYNFFFDGTAQQPVNFVVNIAILDADCQAILARQGFTLRGSGYWQGFVVIPEAASGPGCAMAWFGDQESDGYRRAMYEIDINPTGSVPTVFIANPPPGSQVAPGSRINLFGTTSNPVDGEVRLTIRQGDGTVVATEVVQADRFGYWETDILLPVDLSGGLEVVATSGDGADLLRLDLESS